MTAQRIVDSNRPFANGLKINPEGVFEDELEAYLSGEASSEAIDDSFVWRTKSDANPFDRNFCTEALHYNVFLSEAAHYTFDSIVTDDKLNFDWDHQGTSYLVMSLFADSQRKGLYLPSLYPGWHIAILPYMPDVAPSDVLKFANDSPLNRDFVKIKRYRVYEHQNIENAFGQDLLYSFNPLQYYRIKDATFVKYENIPLKLHNYDDYGGMKPPITNQRFWNRASSGGSS